MAKTEQEKMVTGELFDVYDAELVAQRDAARQQVEAFNALGESDPDESERLIRKLFGATGDSVSVCIPHFGVTMATIFTSMMISLPTMTVSCWTWVPFTLANTACWDRKFRFILLTIRLNQNCGVMGPWVLASPSRWGMMSGSAVAPSFVRALRWVTT